LSLFLAAARTYGGRVLAADNNPLAPSLYLADSGVSLPRVVSPDYRSRLLRLVEQERVQLVVPTIDTELAVLSASAELLRDKGSTALVSSPNLIHITRDKWLTFRSCADAGILMPRSWLPSEVDLGDLPQQLFIKPRDGSASLNTYSVRRERLSEVLPLVPNAIIQERLEGDEVTIDALLDLQGRPIHYVPRRRIRTLAGESIEGVTIDDTEIRPWLLSVLDFISGMGGLGPFTIQCFLTPDGPLLTEINARFGGGFPLTHAAGGHYPEWILRNLLGDSLDSSFGEYRRGLYMTRYYVEHFVEKPLWD
jgi:carbamoyl-phosphate synthase large subunit